MLENLKQQFVKGLKWTSVSAILSIIIGLVQWGIIGRTLTSEEIGLLSYCLVIVGISEVICNLGLSESLIHFQKTSTATLNSMYMINILSSIFTYLILYISAPIICEALTDYNVNEFIAVLRLYGLIIIINAIGNHYNDLLQKAMEFKSLAYFELVYKIIAIAVLIVFMIGFDLSLYHVVLSLLVGNLLFTIQLLVKGIKRFYRPQLIIRFDYNMIKFFKFGMYQIGNGLFTRISASLVRFFIGSLYGVGNLGVYEQAYRIMIKPISIVNPIVSKVNLPTFAILQNDLKVVNRWYLQQIGLISLVIFPFFGLVFFYSEEIVFLLYGNGKEEVVYVLRILCTIGIFISIGNPIGSYLSALGKPNYGFFMNLYRLVLFSVFFLLIKDNYSFYNSIILYAIVFIVGTWPIDIWVRRTASNMSIKEYLSSMGKSLISSILMVASMIFIRQFWFQSSSSAIELVSTMMIGTSIYIMSTYLINRAFLDQIFLLIKRI